MSRRRILLRMNGWTLVEGGVDGLVQLDGATREAALTVRTWRMIVGHPTRPGQLLDGFDAFAADPSCDQIVFDSELVAASEQLAGHRARFQARRRRRPPVQDQLAPVVSLRRHRRAS